MTWNYHLPTGPKVLLSSQWSARHIERVLELTLQNILASGSLRVFVQRCILTVRGAITALVTDIVNPASQDTGCRTC